MIDFEYIKRLQNIENRQGLRAVTKLTNAHINFQNQKMKVCLAVQVLSTSVSNALTFCKSINMDGFENCETTAEFCKNINDVFDILNCRIFNSTSQFSKPLRKNSAHFLLKKIDELTCFIKCLTIDLNNNKFVVDSNRKVGFLGMIICLTNLKYIYDDFIEKDKIKFILSYKLNQDHLENFFWLFAVAEDTTIILLHFSLEVHT